MCVEDSYLVLYDSVVRQTQVHLLVVPELEGTLVELGDRLIYVQDGVLLADLADHLDR